MRLGVLLKAFIYLMMGSLFWAKTFAVGAKVPQKTEVLIIGAGLSGLATAWGLKKAGIPYHILEIAPRVGGRVRTVSYQRPGMPEIRTDSGMEEYWESNPAVEIIKELKLPVTSDVAVSSIYIDNQFYALGSDEPAQFYSRIFSKDELGALKNFKAKVKPWVASLKSEAPVPEALKKYQNISFAQFVGEEKLPRKVSEWIRISLECEIGTAWDRISALDGLAEFHIFLGDGEKCYRVEGGNDRFTQAFSKAVGLDHLSLNKRVTRITPQGVNYLDLETNTNGVIKANHIVSTIPLYRLFEVQFDPPLSEKKQQAIQSMTWGSYFKAHIFLNKSAKRFWTSKGSSNLPILSDRAIGVIYDGDPQEKAQEAVISLLVTGDAAERFNLMPLDVVRAQILGDLEKMWPGFGKEVQDIEFYRIHPRAIAAWPVGRSRFDDLSNEIRKPENRVYLAGDFTESSHSDGAFISAARVVKQIVKASPSAAVATQNESKEKVKQ